MPEGTPIASAESVWTIRPEVRWVVESHGVRILPEDKRAGVWLGYPDAALWDFVDRRLARDRRDRLLAVLTNQGPEAAGVWAERLLCSWEQQGLTKAT